MSEKVKLFQYIAVGVFGVLGILGVMALAGGWGSNTKTVLTATPVTIWGPPLGGSGIENFFLEEATKKGSVFANTKYIEKNPDTLYSDLLEAMALGKGPDAVLLDASELLPLADKISVRPYTSYPLLDFQQTFVQGADVFIFENGLYAYPLFVDPLVLYWNRDLFTNAGVAQAPQDWTTVLEVVPRLTLKNEGTTLVQSAIPLGEYENIFHAKEILSALLFQTGAAVVTRENGLYVTDLLGENQATGTPSIAINFYAAFANPRKDVYTWNKTFERSREAFAANRVAMYVGYASERGILEKINPNLNFTSATLPQSATGKNRATYGKFYGVAVLKSSKNPAATHQVVGVLSSNKYAETLQHSVGLPTARRDSLLEVPTDPFMSIAVRSVLMARDWAQPDPGGVDTTFRRMIEAVANGTSPEAALEAAAADIKSMLSRYNDK